MVALERRDERPEHGHLAGRRPVQPNARRQAVAEADAETPREVAPPVRAQAVREPRRQSDARDEVNEVEQESHQQLKCTLLTGAGVYSSRG